MFWRCKTDELILFDIQHWANKTCATAAYFICDLLKLKLILVPLHADRRPTITEISVCRHEQKSVAICIWRCDETFFEPKWTCLLPAQIGLTLSVVKNISCFFDVFIYRKLTTKIYENLKFSKWNFCPHISTHLSRIISERSAKRKGKANDECVLWRNERAAEEMVNDILWHFYAETINPSFVIVQLLSVYPSSFTFDWIGFIGRV